jgi:hypothetical protein
VVDFELIGFNKTNVGFVHSALLALNLSLTEPVAADSLTQGQAAPEEASNTFFVDGLPTVHSEHERLPLAFCGGA